MLLEGAGGLLVPLQEELTLLDYLAVEGYPLVLVTSPRLGSINHTLLSLEILRARQLRLAGLVYNLYHRAPGEIIHSDETWQAPLEEAIRNWQPAEPSPVVQVMAPRLRELIQHRRQKSK